MQKIELRALERFSSQKFHFEIFPKTNAISITFGPSYIHGQNLEEIDFPTRNAVDRFYRDSLLIGERTLCKYIHRDGRDSIPPECFPSFRNALILLTFTRISEC